MNVMQKLQNINVSIANLIEKSSELTNSKKHEAVELEQDISLDLEILRAEINDNLMFLYDMYTEVQLSLAQISQQ